MKALATLALGLSIVALGSAVSSANPQADRGYEMGVSYERSLKIFEAVDEFREAAVLDPGNTGILEHYAWLLHAYQFREEAVEALERLLKHETDRRAVRLGLGWDEMDLGHATRSIAFFEEAYGWTAPRDEIARAYAEIRERSVKENKAKIAELREQLAADPTNGAVEKELVQFLLYQADWNEAFSRAERLLAASAEDLPFRFVYFKGLIWAGRLAEAERRLSDLMADSPENAFLHYELGKLRRAQGRLKEAAAALTASLSLYPAALKTKRELCEVLALEGRADESLALAAELMRDHADRLDARLAQARAYHYGRRWDEAVLGYRQVLADFPQNVEALSGLAESSLLAGDLSGAEEAADGWEAANGGDPGLRRIRTEIRKASSSVTVQADFFENNSNYRRLNAGFAARVHPWGGVKPRLGYYYSQFRQTRFSDTDRHAVALEGERQISAAVSVDARLGANLYEDGSDHMTGGVTLRAVPSRGTFLSAGYSHFDIIDTEPIFGNPLYNYVASIGAVGLGITTDDVSLYLQQMASSDLMLWGSAAYGAYSDGNKKLTYVVGLDYRIAVEPFLHVHYSFFSLDYQDQAPTYREGDAQVAAYFDPSDFRVHTPGVELAFDLAPSLRVYLADDVSYVASSKSVTNSVACALTYDITREDSLRADFRHIQDIHREDDDGEYRAQHIMLSFSHRF